MSAMVNLCSCIVVSENMMLLRSCTVAIHLAGPFAGLGVMASAEYLITQGTAV